MVIKRGRKRKNDMYFGPDEEAAVVKFLEFREIHIIDFVKGLPLTIKHNLGKEISIDASYVIPNLNAYSTDNKLIEIYVPLDIKDYKENSVTITPDETVSGATVIVIDTINRDLIFTKWLNAPIAKMIESIIRKYKLYRKGFTFEELHIDTYSFLMTKVHKFEPGRNKKAYSYFGTISKNYILGLLIKDDKYINQTASYEDVASNIQGRKDLTYHIDNYDDTMEDFIKKLLDGIKDELNDDDLPAKKKLNENERKIGYVLLEILENWETAFESMSGGSKYNKNSVLETIRNYTNLSTKDIRIAMKRFKCLYDLLKLDDL